MRIGSLFSGIGGLELGLERAGLGRTIWQVERNAFCRAVLAKHWPDADRSVVDVREAIPETLPAVDWIVGGFPCQDISTAGDGAGLDGSRSGLWREMRRVIDECHPFGVVAENVAHGRSRYLCEVRSDLHELGYDTAALLVSAGELGAPHIRDRCFVVAYANRFEIRERAERQPARRARGVRAAGKAEPGHAREAGGRHAIAGVCRATDGVPGRLDRGGSAATPPFRWPLGTGLSWDPPMATQRTGPFHAERLIALGNAVVPQCAEVVGRWILANVIEKGTTE